MPDGRRFPLLAVAGLVAILVAQALVLGAYLVPVMADTDANAYHGTARVFADEGRLYQEPKPDLAYCGRMWVMNEEGRYYAKYPPLFPAMIFVADAVFGEGASMWLGPLSAVLAALGMWVLCRAFLPAWASLLGVVAVASNPVLCSLAVRQHSHAPSVACLTWAMALLFSARDRSPRMRYVLLAVSGFLVGWSTGVRYGDVLFALPALLWIVFRPDRWREGTAWCAGMALPVLMLMAHHWAAFGHPMSTGYSLTEEQSAFSIRSMARHLIMFAPEFFNLSVGPLFLLSVCGFVMVWARGFKPGLVYAAWLGPTAALYLSYYWSGKGHTLIYMRFFLPLLAPLLLLGLRFAVEMVRAVPGPDSTILRRTLILALFASQAVWAFPLTVDELEERHVVNDWIHERVNFVRDTVPKGSTIFGNITLLDSLDVYREYQLHWGFLLDRDELEFVMATSLRGGPDGLQTERARRVAKIVLDPGPEVARERVREIIDATLDDGRAVYLVTEHEASFRRELGDHYEFTEVAAQPEWPARYVFFDPHRGRRFPGIGITRVGRRQ